MFSHFLRPAGDGLAHDVTHLRDLVNAHEGVHLGHELGKFLAETLRKTARNDDGLAALVRVAQLDRFKNRVHALLLRGVNEGAGVDDDGVGARGVVGNIHAAFHERAEHDFGVHEILGAAERNHADAQPACAGRLRPGGRFFTRIYLRHSRRRLAEFWRVAIMGNSSRRRSPRQIKSAENYFTASRAERRWSGRHWWKWFPRHSSRCWQTEAWRPANPAW